MATVHGVNSGTHMDSAPLFSVRTNNEPLRQAQLPQKNLRHNALEEHIRGVGVEVPQSSHAQSVIRHNQILVLFGPWPLVLLVFEDVHDHS